MYIRLYWGSGEGGVKMEVTAGKTEEQKTLGMSPGPLASLPFSPAEFGCPVS